MNKANSHELVLSYDQYKKGKCSIAHTTIGKYVIHQEIGRGAFGAVYGGIHTLTKKQVAVKVLDLVAVEKDPNQKVREIRRRLCKTESQIMQACNSDNLIKCYDVFENKDLKIMVIEFCNGGTLQSEIDIKGRISEPQAISITKQCVNGIAELHRHKIVHRDLKAENVLIHNGVYKIADFGFSKQLQIKTEESELKNTTLGTMTTMAPEVMRRQPYGLKADIWSIGVIFFQMIYGKVPYTSTSANMMYNEIKAKKNLFSEKYEYNGYTASKEATNFLKDILVVETSNRLGWKALTSHPIFKSKGGRIGTEFVINCNLELPENADKYQNEMKEQQDFEHLKPSFGNEKPQQIIRLTQQQAEDRYKEVSKEDDKIFIWAKETHLECLKTELIYDEIIEPIKQNKLLDLECRTVIEFMYLLSTRCLNNMSVINDEMERYKDNKTILSLYNTVKDLYKKILENWQEFSLSLTKMEDKVGSIIADRFLKIFSKESIKEKDRYLGGIQRVEYSKAEQIEFTERIYIKELKTDLKGEGKYINRIKSYLTNYKEINDIKLTDYKGRNFDDHVKMILK